MYSKTTILFKNQSHIQKNIPNILERPQHSTFPLFPNIEDSHFWIIKSHLCSNLILKFIGNEYLN